MKRQIGFTSGVFLCICLTLLAGCAPSVTVIHDDGTLNAMVQGEEVTVVLQDQSMLVVTGFHISDEYVSWTGTRMPRSRVLSVFYRPDPLPRAVRGGLSGLLLGGLIGGVIGGKSMTGEDQSLGAAIGAALGAGAGAVIGLSVGLVTTPAVEYHPLR